MHLDLQAVLERLFDDEPVATAASVPQSDTSTRITTPQDSECDDEGDIDDQLMGGPVTNSGLPFGMKIDTYAEDTIRDLIRERDEYKREVETGKNAYEQLERRVYKSVIADSDLPVEIVRRLKRLDNDNTRYRDENGKLRERLKAVESELATRENEVTGQKNRLKGAGKKVKNAKDAAEKEQEKAKNAVHDKQKRVSSERKLRQERNEAIAEAQSLAKSCEDLQADLEVERSGRPHLRKGDTAADTTTAVIPIELTICRGDFLQLSNVFDSTQVTVTQQLQHWYTELKKPKEVTLQVVGTDYAPGEEEETAIKQDKLYADMVELVDGHTQTAAEHDGPRSKRAL